MQKIFFSILNDKKWFTCSLDLTQSNDKKGSSEVNHNLPKDSQVYLYICLSLPWYSACLHLHLIAMLSFECLLNIKKENKTCIINQNFLQCYFDLFKCFPMKGGYLTFFRELKFRIHTNLFSKSNSKGLNLFQPNNIQLNINTQYF